MDKLGGLLGRAWAAAAEGAGGYRLSAWLFLRLLGLTYLIAFASLWPQLRGLVGSRGILPAADFLQAVSRQVGAERFWLLPTVFWLDASDRALDLVAALGVLAAVLVILDVLPAPALALAWALYLSLASIGRDFLAFQWDALLLEAGLAALLLAPWHLRGRPGAAPPPPRAVLVLFHWLLFRLMFSSGAVKLLSGDETWRSLTALRFHYQTQPLPTVLGWLAHQLPPWFHGLSCAVMFGLELAVPCLIFAPRRGRRAAALALAALQLAIAATGNYAFFNLLTLALCVLLVDDGAWPGRWARTSRAAPGESAAPTLARRAWRPRVVVPAALALLVVATLEFSATLRLAPLLPRFALAPVRWMAPLRSVNTYGLFAVMTTRRPEIVVEGSHDGREWKAYGFRYKPGDPARPPRFVAPHQPRLDWQMWFAALASFRDQRWFIPFLARLLEGSPEVLGLLAENPFPDEPPRFVRARLYDYRFADWATWRREGRWWDRELLGAYSPELARDESVQGPR